MGGSAHSFGREHGGVRPNHLKRKDMGSLELGAPYERPGCKAREGQGYALTSQDGSRQMVDQKLSERKRLGARGTGTPKTEKEKSHLNASEKRGC